MTRRLVGVCVLTLLAPFALSGCIELDEQVALKKDGSGTIKRTFVFDRKKVEELKESMGGMGGEVKVGGDDPKVNHEKAVKRLQKLEGLDGLKLVAHSFKTDETSKKDTGVLEIAFTSLEKYFRSGLEDGFSVSLEKTDDGAWLLTRIMEQEEEGGDDEMQAAMMKGMLAPFLGDLKLAYTLVLPGTIVETNGVKNEAGTAVSWKIGFEDVFDAKKRKMTVKFKGDALALKPFKVTAAEMKAAKAKLEAAEKAAEDKESDEDDG